MDPRAIMFHNRLRKNLRRLLPWARQRGIEALRLYDHDIPEVRLVVDRYGDRVVVWEYARPARRDAREPAGEEAGDATAAATADTTADTTAAATSDTASDTYTDDILAVVAELCEVPSESLYVKLRQRQRGPRQYEKLDSARHEFVIREGGHRFLVNLSDYLDTGLFLDHRETRALVQRLARGKRVLNLFAYTGSFSVYAAAGGAASTVTMDLSTTYLDWAGRNFALNNMDPQQHVRVRAEALSYLRAPRTVPAAAGPFDLIILDPPTFSNSKKMAGTLDVLRDHPLLIADSLRLLAPGGSLLFSCNHHRFSLRADELPGARFQDLSAQTLPRDFHDPRTHRCFLFTRGEPEPLPLVRA
jgi:23S rRNA G2069 N7-methylase RlmK/C1962 C5-methylase RlmI